MIAREKISEDVYNPVKPQFKVNSNYLKILNSRYNNHRNQNEVLSIKNRYKEGLIWIAHCTTRN